MRLTTVARFWRQCALGALLAGVPHAVLAQVPVEHRFDVRENGEAVLSITAGCDRCDWGVAGREAVALKLSLDGVYSQHLVLTRGEAPAEYRVMLGTISTGAHRLTIERDAARSGKETGEARLSRITVSEFGPQSPEYAWLSSAPVLRARPGTIERFSDLPLLMYVENLPGDRGYGYTVIFTHEDGGTPTDRLMATWGRSTDIELVLSVERGNPPKEEYQGPDHVTLPFRGVRAGSHPILWVATDNNMVSDRGADTAIRFAPAPRLVALDNVSREAVMDGSPWLYAVMSAELVREGRIDPSAAAGSGRIPDPRRFAYIEACGDVTDATLAFDVATDGPTSGLIWHATDRGDERFRIARTGCFRAAVPLPAGTSAEQIKSVRARAYTRPPRQGEQKLPPGTGAVVLHRLNTVFMLDHEFRPLRPVLHWTGALEVKGDSPPVEIPATRR